MTNPARSQMTASCSSCINGTHRDVDSCREHVQVWSASSVVSLLQQTALCSKCFCTIQSHYAQQFNSNRLL